MGYKYEFTWLLRLPTEELPKDQSCQGDLLCWKRSSGNIIMGFVREGGRVYPVGMQVIIVTSQERCIGIGRIVKSEIHALPNGHVTTVVEFSVVRTFDEEEERIISKVINEMYGYLPPVGTVRTDLDPQRLEVSDH